MLDFFIEFQSIQLINQIHSTFNKKSSQLFLNQNIQLFNYNYINLRTTKKKVPFHAVGTAKGSTVGHRGSARIAVDVTARFGRRRHRTQVDFILCLNIDINSINLNNITSSSNRMTRTKRTRTQASKSHVIHHMIFVGPFDLGWPFQAVVEGFLKRSVMVVIYRLSWYRRC